MERFENGSDMSGFRSLNNSTSKRVLNLLQLVNWTVWKVTNLEGWTLRIADSSTSHALLCRRAVFEPSRMLVHLCEHSARSSQEPQSDSYNFHEPS